MTLSQPTVFVLGVILAALLVSVVGTILQAK